MKKRYFEFNVDFEDNDNMGLSEDLQEVIGATKRTVPGTVFMDLSEVQSFNEGNGGENTTVRMKNGYDWSLKICTNAFARLIETNGCEIVKLNDYAKKEI